MKIELTIELDIPGMEDFTDAELRQAIFDEYVNYVAVKHLDDAIHWQLVQSRSTADTDTIDQANCLFTAHKAWADIAKSARILKFARLTGPTAK